MDLPGKFRYGSEQVNITADRVCPNGLGTFNRDDSGIPARATDIIIIGSGQPVGYPASRASAATHQAAAPAGITIPNLAKDNDGPSPRNRNPYRCRKRT